MTNIGNITDKYGQTFLEPMEKQGATPTAGTTETTETERPQDDRDRVSLSTASKDMQTAEDAVAGVSDARQDKVNEIKQALENGTYDIDPEKIADKMIGHFVDNVV